MRWDLFCRVVDNFGDVGVCWRLAADLGARGETVRLWLDDASALAWMAPSGAPGVSVEPWRDDATLPAPGDVVIEAFGCDPPAGFLERMAQAEPAPAWINLEYLSAEAYVERSHGLRSPVTAGPAAGLTKWFFYPGFTPRTGGLLGERGLIEGGAAAETPPAAPSARTASVFCYANPQLPRLAAHWPGRLLLAPGPAQSIGGARTTALNWQSQTEYDRLLRRCDLNFVRGEDSFVRAQWAGRPFVWQIYPQDDGAHRAKLEAFLDLYLDGAEVQLAADLRQLWRAWNSFGDWPARWPDTLAWRSQARRWRDRLLAQDDLVTQLQRFAAQRR